MLRWMLAVMALSLGAPAFAQETRSLTAGAASPPATIAQVGWLKGSWSGPGIEGATATESYTAATADQMSGHFEQLDAQGGVRFYELLQIAERDGSLVYRIRHFRPDLTGWEDKAGKPVEFALVAIAPDAVHFDGLSFYRTGADTMREVVRVEGEGAAARELAFDYRRIP